ncbi:MAG: SpoVG family protein [Clostridiales bacterium]|nr:SpoVG family protein [Clostridiales bacterium]
MANAKAAAQAAPANEQAAQDHDAYLLTEAPIAEMAEAFNMSIDDAVTFRVNAAVEAALGVEVNVRAIEPRGKLIGLAEVTIGGLKVDDFKVFNGDKGLFLGPPSVKDPSSRSGFRRTAKASEDLQAVLDAKALDGYNAAVDKLVARAAAAQAMTVKPRPIKEQMDEAGREAAKANAARTAPEKPEKAARDDR